MTWLKIDDGFGEHPKILGLSDSAFRLHVTALCYCARNLTDGFVSALALRSVGANAKLTRPNSTASTLIKAGLWIPGNDGHWIKDYLDYNPSKAHVERERTAARERMRDRRSKSHDPECSPERSPERSGTPTRPLNAKAFDSQDTVNPPEPTAPNSHSCPRCPLVFATARELDTHLDVVHWVEPPAQDEAAA